MKRTPEQRENEYRALSRNALDEAPPAVAAMAKRLRAALRGVAGRMKTRNKLPKYSATRRGPVSRGKTGPIG